MKVFYSTCMNCKISINPVFSHVFLLRNSNLVVKKQWESLSNSWLDECVPNTVIIEAEQFCLISSNAFETRNCIQFFTYIVLYLMYLFLCTLTMVWFSRRVYNFLSLLLQAPDICRAKNIFVLSLDEIIENNIALAVFIGKYVQM